VGNLFDFLIIAVFVITVVVCFKSGIFKLLIPFRKLAAFVAAYSLKDSTFVNSLIGKIFKADSVKAFLNKRIDAMWGEQLRDAAGNGEASIAERFDEVFGFAGKLFSNLKDFCISLYDKQFVSGEAESVLTTSEKIELFVRDTVNYLTDVTASFFTTLLSFVILYLVLSFAFKYGAKLLDALFSEGFFGLLNHTMGALAGVFYGFLICWLISIGFVLIIPLITPIDMQTVVSGYFGVTEWFYTKFFISQIIGITL
jgi:hypothetical protein